VLDVEDRTLEELSAAGCSAPCCPRVPAWSRSPHAGAGLLGGFPRKKITPGALQGNRTSTGTKSLEIFLKRKILPIDFAVLLTVGEILRPAEELA